MTTAGQEIPGPLTKWQPNIVPVERLLRLGTYPATLYPKLHLDSMENSGEEWGNRRKGYTHIEDLYLVSTTNYGSTGNCYFMAIATLLYGSKSFWHTVKGHHLQYVDSVLRNKDHPRYDLYTQLNSTLSTSSPNGANRLNLWMRLCTPYAWQDGETLQITADLYDVFIVQYSMTSRARSQVTGVKIRGNYNSTHWMIRFVDDNHFQPLRPADQPLSEFSFPPITRTNTVGKVSIPATTPQGATDLNHPWRSPISRQDVPEQLVPRHFFRELSTLNFTLITGFNTRTSVLDSNYLNMELHRASTRPRLLPPLADGTEAITSKLIKDEEARTLTQGTKHYLEPSS